jgi:hypothetical protein
MPETLAEDPDYFANVDPRQLLAPEWVTILELAEIEDDARRDLTYFERAHRDPSTIKKIPACHEKKLAATPDNHRNKATIGIEPPLF